MGVGRGKWAHNSFSQDKKQTQMLLNVLGQSFVYLWVRCFGFFFNNRLCFSG